MRYLLALAVFFYVLNANATLVTDVWSERNTSIPNPFGVCGNGIQEVLPQEHTYCPFGAYAVTINEDSSSDLLIFNQTTGESFSLGAIKGVNSVSAIDFSPNGRLYGIGRDDQQNTVLFHLNCFTNRATIIDAVVDGLNDPLALSISDIDFDAQGRLWAYALVGDIPMHFLISINPITAKGESVGTTGQRDTGNGITASFDSSSLYHAGQNEVVQFDKYSGQAYFVSNLDFPSSLSRRAQITSLDTDFFTKIVFGIVSDGDSNYFVTLRPTTGKVRFLSSGQIPAPSGLSGVAINRSYEECDQGIFNGEEMPAGTACAINCTVAESNCNNAIDDDYDGLTDEADNDCSCLSNGPNTCDDNNLCTEDSCAVGNCIHKPLNGPYGAVCDTGYSGVCGQGKFNCASGTQTRTCEPIIQPNQFVEECHDGLDNDCNGFIDGDDIDCSPLYIFITSQTFSGGFGGYEGADAICNSAAFGSILTGEFVAFVSDNNSHVRDRIKNPTKRHWYLMDNFTRIALTKEDLLDGNLLAPININEFGREVPTSVAKTDTWTGTDYNGMATDANCMDWTVDMFAYGSAGSSGYTDFRFSGNGEESCHDRLRLICIQTP